MLTHKSMAIMLTIVMLTVSYQLSKHGAYLAMIAFALMVVSHFALSFYLIGKWIQSIEQRIINQNYDLYEDENE